VVRTVEDLIRSDVLEKAVVGHRERCGKEVSCCVSMESFGEWTTYLQVCRLSWMIAKDEI
jgi:hypothetical protein